MFLVERMLGVSIYMLVLIAVCFLLLKTTISCRLVLRFYLVCLCCMAFFYKPYRTADLYRIFEMMDYFSTMKLGAFWEDYALESTIPLARFLFWFFGRTGCNELLPAFSAFFCYSLIFYIIKKSKQRYDISNQTVAIVLFFIMTTSMYISVIGGIRMMIALSMLAFSYFRATVEKRIRAIEWLFFFASIFIHTMSVVVIGIIALTLLFDSHKSKLKRMGYFFVIGLLAAGFLVRFNDTAQELFDKFLAYVLGDKHSDPWEYLMGAFIVILLLLAFYEFRFIRRAGCCIEVNKYNMAAVLSVVLAVIFFFEFSIFYRFGGHVAVMFSIPSLMITVDKTKGVPQKYFRKVDLQTIVILCSCAIAIISCTRGSLSSLKFFEL